jgi:hypothetical protein
MATLRADSLHPATGTDSSHTGSGMKAAKENAEHLTERVKDKAADLKRQAKDAVHDMGVHARSAADEQKNVAAERVSGVARALRVASDDLHDQGQSLVAGYSRQVAEGLESMAQSLSRRSLGDLVEGVEDFARERPVAVLGGAMVAGFALARFMKSSAGRRSEQGAGRPTATSPAGGAMPAASRPATPGTRPPGAGIAESFSTGMETAGVNKESGDAAH